MAKTLSIELSPSIIADFETCFEKKEDERAFIYKQITGKINEAVGDVFQKRTCQIITLENGQRVKKSSTLDEINFEKTELPSNVQWKTEDIAGKLSPYEYLVGATLLDKITNYCKLFYITNKIFNESIIQDSKNAFTELKLKNGISAKVIKTKEDEIKEMEVQVEKSISEDCFEGYVYSLILTPILAKIKAKEQEILDKEFAELNKPKEPNKR